MKNLDIKFDIGDEIYFLLENRVCSAVVESFESNVFLEKDGVKNWQRIKVNDYGDLHNICATRCYSSLKELIESITVHVLPSINIIDDY